MGESIISGDSQWSTLSSESGTFVVRDLTITAAKEIGIFARNSNAVFENIEVDGSNWGVSSDPGDALFIGVGVANLFSENTTANLRNIYVHDFNVDVNQLMGIAFVGGGDTGGIDFTASNMTIENNLNTNSNFAVVVGSGLFTGGTASGTLQGTTSNLTVSNIISTNQAAAGYAQTMITQGSNQLNTALSNSTFANIQSNGSSPLFGSAGAINLFAAAGVSSAMTLTTSNLILASGSTNCKTINMGLAIDANTFSGTVSNNIISNGGNLSHDSTCSPHFNQSTDGNNLTNLASTLGPLSNNGGYVPTMPLLAGSPAIDSGVTISGLTADARGVTRPQGQAYDSGAYEYVPVATLASTGNSVMVTLLAVTTLIGLAGVAQLLRVNMLQ